MILWHERTHDCSATLKFLRELLGRATPASTLTELTHLSDVEASLRVADNNMRLLFLCPPPVSALCIAMAQGTPPGTALRDWKGRAQEILRLSRRHRRITTIVSPFTIVRHPRQLFETLGLRLGDGQMPAAPRLDTKAGDDLIFQLLANHALNADIPARILASELEASTLDFSGGALWGIFSADRAFAQYQDMVWQSAQAQTWAERVAGHEALKQKFLNLQEQVNALTAQNRILANQQEQGGTAARPSRERGRQVPPSPEKPVAAGGLVQQLTVRLGRAKPVSQVELRELRAILADIESGTEASESLAARIRVNGPGLLALLSFEPPTNSQRAELAGSSETFIRKVLSASSVPDGGGLINDARRGVADRPLSGLAASADWHDPRWLSFVPGFTDEEPLDAPGSRNPWIWERAHFLYGLDRIDRSRPIRNVLAVCELQEDLINKLVRRFGGIDLLDVNLLLKPAMNAGRPSTYFIGDMLEETRGVEQLSRADFDRLPNGCYDAIVLPHASALVGGPDKFANILSQLDPKLAVGGTVAFSAHIPLGRASSNQNLVDVNLAGDDGLVGRILRGTSFDWMDGVDMTLCGHDLGLFGPPQTPGVFSESAGDEMTWPGVFFLGKSAETPRPAWERVLRDQHDASLGDQTKKLRLSPGSRRIGDAIVVSPRRERMTAFYGPYIRLSAGTYRASARLRLDGSGIFKGRIDGILEVVAGTVRLAEVQTSGAARIFGREQSYVMDFDIPHGFDQEIEIRAVVATNVAVRFFDIMIERKMEPQQVQDDT